MTLTAYQRQNIKELMSNNNISGTYDNGLVKIIIIISAFIST